MKTINIKCGGRTSLKKIDVKILFYVYCLGTEGIGMTTFPRGKGNTSGIMETNSSDSSG